VRVSFNVEHLKAVAHCYLFLRVRKCTHAVVAEYENGDNYELSEQCRAPGLAFDRLDGRWPVRLSPCSRCRRGHVRLTSDLPDSSCLVPAPTSDAASS
jgi:hypothetical protein